MPAEYRLQALLEMRQKRVEAREKDVRVKQLVLEEQQRRLEALQSQEAPFQALSELDGREHYVQHTKGVIEGLQRELDLIQCELEEEQKELWVLQMHKEKWLAEQE